MSTQEESTPEIEEIELGALDSADFASADEQYYLIADHPTMPAIFDYLPTTTGTRAWIHKANESINLRVAHEAESIAMWDDNQGWVPTLTAPPGRGADFEQSEESTLLAYELLSLGWDVTTRADEKHVTVLARPRSAKTGRSIARAWEALHVLPGSQLVYIWKRQSLGADWVLDEAESGTSGIDRLRVFVDESEATLLALTIAPDWLMPPELNAEPKWHSTGATVAETELPEDSYAPLPDPDGEEIANRKAALVEWIRAEQMDGPFADRAAVCAFLASRSRVGHYVLAFRDGGCYIGETTDFEKRFAQHEKTYPDRIESFYLRCDEIAAQLGPRIKERKRRLVKVERQLIHDAQDKQLYASNFREMANPVQPWPGFTDLLDDPEQIADWFTHPDIANQNDLAHFRSLKLNDFVGARDKILQYRADLDAQQVNRIIEAYLRRCVPFPARTELESWAISCLPVAKRGTKGGRKWSVIACVSISKTEALTMLREDWSQKAVGFIAVNEIEAGLADEGGMIRLIRQHPGVRLNVARHREFGPGTMILHAADLDGLERLLDDATITRAASTTALRLCRIGPSMHRAVHNPFLVDDALRTGRTWSK